MSEWQPIDSAPKDGTEIRVRNGSMDFTVIAKWGERRAPWGSVYPAFVLVKDEGKFPSIPVGSLIIPTEWQPVDDDTSPCVFCAGSVGEDAISDKNGEVACKTCGEAEISAQAKESALTPDQH